MTEIIDKLRNVVFVGHGGSGKTSLAEIMLYKGGVINRIGRIEEGNTAMDYDPEELKRGVSLSSSFHQFPWKSHTVNMIVTPGDQNFFSDTKLCMKAADGVLVVVDAVSGVAVRTEQALSYAEDYGLPCLMFINKLDRERADFFRTLKDASDIIPTKLLVTQIPMGSEASFRGVVDLISQKAYIYDNNGKATISPIPDDLADIAEEQRESMVETALEADDSLLERYLEGETLTNEEILSAIKKGVHSRLFIPVICGSGIKNIGIDLAMDAMIGYLPSPIERGPMTAKDQAGNEVTVEPDPKAPFMAFVFKTVVDPYAGRLSVFRIVSGTLEDDGQLYNTTKQVKERYTSLLRMAGKEQKSVDSGGPGSILAVAKLKETKTGDTLCSEDRKLLFTCPEPIPPVISFAIAPKSKGDEDKIYTSLIKLLEEDSGLQIYRNVETKEMLLSGGGLVHIEATVDKLRRKFNVEVQISPPKVPYRETIKKKVRVQGKHKKQSGGHGQFGDCWIQMEPLPRGEGFQFVDQIVGGSIPRQYIPAVEKGVVESSQRGMLAGFPCVDFRVTVDDGSYHAVDSSEMAFKIAGSLAFKKAVEQAKPILLEPVMKVTVTAPDEFLGDIMGDLNSRRGRVLGMDSEGKKQTIKANVPMSEIVSYAPDLNSMTGGRGTFSVEFSHYDEVPAELAQKIIDEVNKNKE
ncbi:MAG: elongation factor G [Desulfobacterales bacterium]|nr:elongation factor G [Desulfobacterales bacterium]